MSKYTATKLYRLRDKSKLRGEPLSPTTRKPVDCPNCGGPVFVAPNQIVYGHKACRAEMNRRARFIRARK